MNNIWEFKKLSQVCLVIAGQSPEGKYYNTNSDGLPFYQGKKEFKDKYIGEPTKWTTKITKEAIAGDILMSVRAPVGPVNFATQKICIGRGLAAIRATKSIDKSYLFYYFIRQKNKIVGNEGAVFNSINKTQIENLNVPIPPIPEQKRIVKILDEAFAAINKAKANAEKNLQNSRELFDSYLNKVFAPSTSVRLSSAEGSGQRNPGEDWIECLLNDYVKFIDYRGKTPEKTTHGMRLITAKNIKNGYLQREPEEFVNPKIYDSWMTRGIPQKGDILFTTEAPLANVAQLDTDEKVVFAQRTIIFQPDPKVLNQSFLKYLLLSKPIKTRIIEKGTGATVKGIKARLLKQIPIYFPQSLDEQEIIVNKLDNLSDEIKKLESIYQQKQTDLEELKKSILQKAFNGELKL